MIRRMGKQNTEEFRPCGTKAYHLAKLQAAGFAVPPFLCMEEQDMQRPDELRAALKEAGIVSPYAVRSSAEAEDGTAHSFAGQFTTHLFVGKEELEEKLADCFSQAEQVMHQQPYAMHVVIQQMIPADCSGVFFTQNPLGILSEAVTVVGAGIGSGVVEDKVPTTTYYDNLTDGVSYHTTQQGAPLMEEPCRRQLLEDQKRLEEIFGQGLDVEFAVTGGRLYYLQVRPITTLQHKEKIVLDSSNIIESYPGTTLPLTADFVSRQYTAIFRGVMTRLSGSDAIVRAYQTAFDHMVECCNGRMYYRIENWYGMIGFLPFSRKIIPVWREMLGVSDDGEKPLTFPATWWQKASVALHTLYYFFCAPKKMKQLDAAFDEIALEFQTLQQRDMELAELGDFLQRMETQVMARWDYTLINDMYTFLHTAIAKRLMKRRGLGEEQAQTAIADFSQLASMQPVKQLLKLAEEWKKNGESPAFRMNFKQYIAEYGDRSVGELKLETETFRERPERLMEQIKTYGENPQLTDILSNLEKEKQQLPVGGLAGAELRRARMGIENRECSRMNRTRLFGFARELFLRAGRKLQQQNRLENERDVFYLTTQEVFHSEGDLRPLVLQRQLAEQSDREYPAYTRLIFDGAVVQKPCREEILCGGPEAAQLLRGTPCSAGKAEGEVVLVEDPATAGETAGKIVVTRSTDPGWAFMLAQAKGLISEKGSLLSHSAIISRELHIPAIVAVPGVTALLRTGDKVEMDCETGFIRRL